MKKLNRVKLVRDCMTCDPASVRPNDSLQRVVELLRRRDIRSVPVLEDGRLIGIVSDRDVRQVLRAIRCCTTKRRFAVIPSD
jgi:CBS domain-containing protein